MSFILDALRKSDAERQRNAAPAVTDARYSPRPRQRSLWLPILAMALLANLVFFGWRSIDRGAVPPVAEPEAPTATIQPLPAAQEFLPEPVPAPVRPAERQLPAVRPLAREADPEPVAAPERTDGPVEAPVVAEMTERPAARSEAFPTLEAASEPAREMAAVTAPAAAPAAESPSVRISSGLPTAAQLVADGRLPGPELALELHVYSNGPQSRFVIINGRRYNEGAALNEGPTVESITPDGVILSSRGTRFHLPRR